MIYYSNDLISFCFSGDTDTHCWSLTTVSSAAAASLHDVHAYLMLYVNSVWSDILPDTYCSPESCEIILVRMLEPAQLNIVSVFLHPFGGIW